MATGEGESPGGPAQNVPDRAQLKRAAAEFESFFIYYMLKSMRQAIPKGGLLDSRHRDTYTGLLDQEVASLAARRGGFGLGKAIENQFFPSQPVRPSSFPTGPPIEGTVKEGP
jgi:flagellar protein FlgJ